MKRIKLLHVIFVLAISQLIVSSCKELVIKEIDITYQVTATTLERDLTIYYANDLNGEDVVNDTVTLLWEKTYTVESDTANQRKYDLSVYCWEAWPDPISQTVTVRIIEDGEVVVEKFTGGSASIGYNDTHIFATLPSKIRYED